jgi:FxsC-like protein
MTDTPDFHAVHNAFASIHNGDGRSATPLVAKGFQPPGEATDARENQPAADPRTGPEPAPPRSVPDVPVDPEHDARPTPLGASRRPLPWDPPDPPQPEPDSAAPPAPRPADDPGDADSPPHTATRTVLAVPPEEGGGPKRVIFVLAVASADELSALRSQLDYYGNQFDEWMPYHPHVRQRVCVSAQAIAASQEMSSTIVRLNSGISDLLEASKARNEVVVFIIDVWTATLEPFRTALIEYDGRNEPTTSVLVPWNPNDVETAENATKLRTELAQTLPNNMIRRDHLLRLDIRSHDEFGKILQQVLTDSQARIFASRTALRGRSIQPRRRPFLEGP